MIRDDILKIIMSKNIDIATFNFDSLIAPPIEYFLSREDMNYLIYLANSPRFSSKIDFKYEEIDKIMRNRGFRLLGRGTNRVCYRYLENSSICMKIAIDHIGVSDNPREFFVQEYLKPHVAKVFHVDQTGTIAVCERVHGISTRQEFLQYSDKIYDLIRKKITSRYVVNDIGTQFFMNWGIRYSTGEPVLLDYPYIFELDINKAKCMRPLDDGSLCCGDIDYDDGYNKLRCLKCGAEYKAYELAKDIEERKLKIVGEGDKKHMKINIKKNGEIIRTVETHSQSKKIDVNIARQKEISKVAVKEAIAEHKESEKKVAPVIQPNRRPIKPIVKSTTGNVSVVIKNSEEVPEKVYNTKGNFIPEKKEQPMTENKNVTVETNKNGKSKKIFITLSKEKSVEQRKPEKKFNFVKVKVNGKAVSEEELEEERAKIVNEVPEAKIENADIVNKDETSMYPDTMKTFEMSAPKSLERASIYENLPKETEEVEIPPVESQEEEAVVEEAKVEEPMEVTIAPTIDPVSEETEEEEKDQSLNDVITEAVIEATNGIIDDIDNVDETSENSEATEAEIIAKAAEDINYAKKSSKKKNKKTKYDPTFYRK